MRFLLDTHAFLWWIDDDTRLSSGARRMLADGENEIFFSVASAWEMGIKMSIGKLELDDDLEPYLQRHLTGNGIEVMGVTLKHTSVVATLPMHHRDPFDRMLVAQAIAEDVPLLTSDPKMSGYPVEVVWQ